MNEALAELEEFCEDAKFDGWDGEGSVAVSKDIKSTAVNFLKSLHSLNLEFPEMCVKADGEIAFNWINSKENFLSISIGKNGTLSFLHVYYLLRGHGKFQFSGNISRGLEELIKSL